MCTTTTHHYYFIYSKSLLSLLLSLYHYSYTLEFWILKTSCFWITYYQVTDPRYLLKSSLFHPRFRYQCLISCRRYQWRHAFSTHGFSRNKPFLEENSERIGEKFSTHDWLMNGNRWWRCDVEFSEDSRLQDTFHLISALSVIVAWLLRKATWHSVLDEPTVTQNALALKLMRTDKNW